MILSRFCVLWTLCIGLLIPLYGDEGALKEVWLLQQDFVKLGKKEIYESSKKGYLTSLARYGKNKGVNPFYGMQDLNSSEYLYLIPVKTYGGLESFFKLIHGFHSSFSKEEWAHLSALRNSTINFLMRSMLISLPSCSSLPKGQAPLTQPYLGYHWLSIIPGQEEVFQQHLQDMVAIEQSRKTPTFWSAWRVSIGGDLPKYLIMVYGSSEKELEEKSEELDFVSGAYKQLLRKEKKGLLQMRADLSLSR